jgi:hypothetical protein
VNNQFSAAANRTCTTGGNCLNPSAANAVSVNFGPDGSFTVGLRGRNPFVPGLVGGLMDINAQLSFSPNSSGSYDVSGARDGFPSLEVYHWRNGTPSTLVNQGEQTPASLLPPMERRVP